MPPLCYTAVFYASLDALLRFRSRKPQMIGQEEDAEEERYERCKLPHIRKLMQDRPCKEQSYQGDYAGERTRFRHGYSVDSFYPKYFLEPEEKDAVYEQQWQRGPHIADRTAEAKKVQKRKKGRR